MMLSFGEAVRQFYGHYVIADGRASRSAFWWVQLYQIILILVFVIVVLMAEGGSNFIENVLDAKTPEDLTILWNDLGASGQFAMFAVLGFSLINFLPGIMLNIRRFHDLGYSGWLVFAFFIAGVLPVFGTFAGIANYIWFALPGTDGPNEYGQDPLRSNSGRFG